MAKVKKIVKNLVLAGREKLFFITYDLLCKFCGESCGQMRLPKGKTPESEGVLDTRCDKCIKTHGLYNKKLNNRKQRRSVKKRRKKKLNN